MSNKHVISDLYQMQSLSLDAKVRMTQRRIREWVDEYGEDGVYISFSGGKDSTVLLNIARKLYPNIRAVFVDTGLEYPEIRAFVKGFDNVDWIRPKLTFREVIEKYGYPFISKEVSETVYYARKYMKSLDAMKEENTIPERERVPYCAQMADLIGVDRRTNKENPNYKMLKKGIIPSTPPVRFQILLGTLKHKEKGVQTEEISEMYNKSRYKFFLDSPFEISAMCCKVMKKSPMHTYQNTTGRKPMTAQMASESRLRTQQWLKNGCNGFDMKSPISNPMSFWTEQDVLLYIRQLQDEYDQNLTVCNMEVRSRADKIKRRKARKYIKKNPKRFEICSVYGKVVTEDEAHGQMTLADVSNMEIFDLGRPVLKTTGCERTGCMFCGYGCHLEKSPGRFEKMKLTHPKQYEYIMKPWNEGGLGFKEIIDWINEHGNLNIRY